MYLANASIGDIIKKQYRFKMRAYIWAFIALMVAQLAAFGFSILSGSGMMGTSFGDLSVKVTYYDGNLLVTFTLLWAFTTGTTLTTKQTRYGDFAFATNRLTSHLSNIAFIVTASIIAGITTMLASNLLKVCVIFWGDINNMVYDFIPISFLELVIGILATTLYAILIAAIGYIIGMLVQLSKVFIFVIPAFFIVLTMNGGDFSIEDIVMFFSKESSLFLFAVKVLVTIGILFITSILISNRWEVRR
ncbi:hypothetical protein [Calidifontibacillus oryziterrae]|uniref:hypothetical protein n=1 Tax=Calidifontibacillus oryziterrae TaxID=1191699 RepID=UPI000318AC95|nr:hypothetical protein [Calidifontibacillus oryziterrae]